MNVKKMCFSSQTTTVISPPTIPRSLLARGDRAKPIITDRQDNLAGKERVGGAGAYFWGMGRWQKKIEEVRLIHRQSLGTESGPGFCISSRRRLVKPPIGAGCNQRASR